MRLKLVGILASFGAVAMAPNMALAQTAEPLADTQKAAHQAAAIARLIEVWGFVKYHHADAREGRLAMDVEFFVLYPQVSEAGSLEAADRVLAQWLDRLGPGAPCDPCAEEPHPSDIATPSGTPQWLATLPDRLAQPLAAIYANRSADPANFVIETERGTGKPLFVNEPDYSNTARRADEDVQLLAVARVWNTLRYWFPYRDLMDEPPAGLLPEAVAHLLASESEADFQRAVSWLAARGNDGHIGINAYIPSWFPPLAGCTIPYSLRPIEGRLVIDGRNMPDDAVLQRGDAILAIDGDTVEQIGERIRPYIAASNQPSMMRSLSAGIRVGACGPHELLIERGGENVTVSVEWQDWRSHRINAYAPHYQPGDAIETLPGDITYVRYFQLKEGDVETLLERANASAGLIIDMRGYVSANIMPELGGMMVEEKTPFVVHAVADPATPGQFLWSDARELKPDAQGRRFTVPIVALIDESAGSSPEYVTMAWRAAGIPVVGSPSAGADGDVTQLPLPDGAEMRFSGLAVHYPDRGQTQRIGIVPDILVLPTIAGIAEGRDEVLEHGIAEVERLGRESDPG